MGKALISNELIIAIDFDGTITTESDCGKELKLRPECKRVLRKLHDDGVQLILWTCRTGKYVEEARNFLREEDLLDVFDAVNDHIYEIYEQYPLPSRKVGADLYVDDKNFGCKLETLWVDLENYVYGR